MSSWDRSRHIPWSRIPQDGSDLGTKKERIFRDLNREADQQQKANNTVQATPSADGSTASERQQITNNKVTFRWPDLFKSAAFGGCIGSITGTVFGFMDGMRTAGQSDVLKNASNMAKGRYLLQGTTRSATLFGVFFGGFHVLKYGLRVAVDPGEWSEIGLAGVVSMGALMSKPAFRPSMPYASMLIIMDGVHIVMREFN
jgi:hypothetical protein